MPHQPLGTKIEKTLNPLGTWAPQGAPFAPGDAQSSESSRSSRAQAVRVRSEEAWDGAGKTGRGEGMVGVLVASCPMIDGF